MKSFVINLDRRPDRYVRFKSEFQMEQCERVSAVDHRDIVWTDELKVRVCDWNFIHNPHRVKNVVACCLSHLALWDVIRTLDVPYAVVYEDDAAYINGPCDLDMLHYPDDFGVIWLNNLIQDTKQLATGVSVEPQVIPHLHYQYTTESYIITPAFAARLYAEISNSLGAVDAHMAQVIAKVEQETGRTVSFQVWPPVMCQCDRTDTDVQR